MIRIANTIGMLLLVTALYAVEEAPPAVEAIQVETVHKRDAPIRVDHARGSVVQAIYVHNGKWGFLPDHHFVRFDDYTIMAAPPGDYMLTLGGSKIIKVVGNGPNPEPEPKPDPNPEPNPNPEKFKINWAIWLYEHENEADNFAASMIMRSATTDTMLRAKGITRRLYEEEQDAAKRFLPMADKLPALILLDESSGSYKVLPAPKTSKELTEAIARYGT